MPSMPSGWTPADIGFTFLGDFNQPSTLTPSDITDGTNITSITDAGGTARVVNASATVARQPQYETDEINGAAVGRFSGDVLLADAASRADFNGVRGLTFACAVKRSATGIHTLMRSNSGATTATFDLQFNVGHTLRLSGKTTGDPLRSVTTAATYTDTSAWLIIVGIVNYAGDFNTLRVNGAVAASGAASYGNDTLPSGHDLVTVACTLDSGAAQNFAGDMRLFGVVPRALTTVEAQKVEFYLASLIGASGYEWPAITWDSMAADIGSCAYSHDPTNDADVDDISGVVDVVYDRGPSDLRDISQGTANFKPQWGINQSNSRDLLTYDGSSTGEKLEYLAGVPELQSAGKVEWFGYFRRTGVLSATRSLFNVGRAGGGAFSFPNVQIRTDGAYRVHSSNGSTGQSYNQTTVTNAVNTYYLIDVALDTAEATNANRISTWISSVLDTPAATVGTISACPATLTDNALFHGNLTGAHGFVGDVGRTICWARKLTAYERQEVTFLYQQHYGEAWGVLDPDNPTIAPTITDPGDKTFTRDEAITPFTITKSAGDDWDTIELLTGNLPTGLNAVETTPGSVLTISGTPTVVGVFSNISFRATNDGGTDDTAAFSITIEGITIDTTATTALVVVTTTANATVIATLKLANGIAAIVSSTINSGIITGALVTVSSDQLWLTVEPTQIITNDTVQYTINTTGLAPGVHVANITITHPRFFISTIVVTITITSIVVEDLTLNIKSRNRIRNIRAKNKKFSALVKSQRKAKT